MKKSIKSMGIIAAVAVAVFTGCGSKDKVEGVENKTHIIYSKGAGPYTELFEEAIIPVLEEKGYTFTSKEMDLSQADSALTSGDVDVTVEQHKAYMVSFNKEAGGNLVELSKIPTVAASVFSGKHTSLEEIGSEMVIAVPQDPGNQARAFIMLRDIGWITLKDGIDLATVNVEDVASNPHNLKFYELDTTYIATNLSDFDYGVITGSIVYNAGMDPSTALFKENLTENFWLQVVVNKDNEDAQWAKDIVEVYQSEAFLNWIEENNSPKYNDLWSIPTYD